MRVTCNHFKAHNDPIFKNTRVVQVKNPKVILYHVVDNIHDSIRILLSR